MNFILIMSYYGEYVKAPNYFRLMASGWNGKELI